MNPLTPVKFALKATVATPAIWRAVQHKRRPGVAVLTYHRIGRDGDVFPHLNVASFASQMQWLRSNCDVIAPEDLRKRAREASPSGSRPTVLITFDDGYRDYFDNAFPVLKSARIRAVNFLCTAFNDRIDAVGWWDQLYVALQATRRRSVSPPWSSQTFTVDGAGKAHFLRACKAHIKDRPECEKEETIATILKLLGVGESSLAVPRQAMTWEEVRASASFTCFGGHTHTHVIASRVDGEALEHEVHLCRDRIHAETGVVPHMFAYPNGRQSDFNDTAKEVLAANGFDTAFTSIDGLVNLDTDWMEVRRMDGGTSVSDLAWRLSRLWR